MASTRVFAGIAVALLCAWAGMPAMAEDPAPVISNFKFGLVCGANNNRRVCFETNVIQVTNESRCVYNGETIPCTWYGLSFDYEAASDVKINCNASTDTVVARGNPKELLKPTASASIELELKKGEHHFFVGQYISGEKNDHSPQHGTQSCSFADKLLFSADYQYQFTDTTQPVESVPDVNKVK